MLCINHVSIVYLMLREGGIMYTDNSGISQMESEIKILIKRQLENTLKNLGIITRNAEVGKKIGKGASSEVFEIISNKRIVGVLKIVEINSDKRSHKMIMREVECLKKYNNNANSVQVYEYGISIDGDFLYINMEHLIPLSQWIISNCNDKNEIPIQNIVRMGIEICNLLIEMENEENGGIDVHRDIKIDNIFVEEKSGTFKLGDFGVTVERQGTKGGASVWGTPNTMAPEAATANAVPQSDQYSLAAVMCAMLKYIKGYEINDCYFEYNLRLRNHDADVFAYPTNKPCQHLEDKFIGIQDIIRKAYSWSKEERYKAAKEFQNELIKLEQKSDLFQAEVRKEQALADVSLAVNNLELKYNVQAQIPLFVKMFKDKVAVVECSKNNGGEFFEFDPFHPEEKWPANVRWDGKNEVAIKVGEYSLKAARKNKESNVFQGVERGPDGEYEITIFMQDRESADKAPENSTALRLAKITAHLSVIVDCDATGDGVEYDPFKPDEKWDVSVSWATNDEINIKSGAYWLKAWRVRDGAGADYFQGIETGPDGNSKFNVYILSTDAQRLDKLPSTEWLLFRSGAICVVEGNLLDPNVDLTPVLRRLGVAWLMFPARISQEHPNMENCSAQGIQRGKHESIKVKSFPDNSPNACLHIDIDSRERPGKYTWYDHFFWRDDRLCAYAETDSMILFPIK